MVDVRLRIFSGNFPPSTVCFGAKTLDTDEPLEYRRGTVFDNLEPLFKY
jgi:hypothetical protein